MSAITYTFCTQPAMFDGCSHQDQTYYNHRIINIKKTCTEHCSCEFNISFIQAIFLKRHPNKYQHSAPFVQCPINKSSLFLLLFLVCLIWMYGMQNVNFGQCTHLRPGEWHAFLYCQLRRRRRRRHMCGTLCRCILWRLASSRLIYTMRCMVVSKIYTKISSRKSV